MIRRHSAFPTGVFTLAVVLRAATLQAQAGSETEFVGIPRFHQVDEHVYRGALPTLEGLQALARTGIATVLDLRAADERSGREEREVLALGMHYENVPMRSLHAPTQGQIERALHIVQDSSRWPVFVHCRYGVDRTGTLIACYRIQAEGWPNEKAREEADQMGMHRMEYGMKRFILRFLPEGDR